MPDEFDIAIVGMAGRFPGARNVDEFWQNLAAGVESIARLTDEEIVASGVPASWLAQPNYVKAAPVLDEPGHFDARFFGFSPTEARDLDPQHRVLLELAHEALESAGYDPDQYPGRIGVFAGSALNTYYTSVGLDDRLAEDYIPTLIGNDKDFLATRISYKLNLKGPSIAVQTACSTSLVAVHLARQSLLTQESDMALAGAISIRVPHRAGYFYDAGGVVSPDGHVRAFDAGANGTVFGSGGGILVLKRLADALRDGDNVRAVIRGSAVNNDGSEKAGYTAPSVNSQADAVVEALANADVDADTITYVEAHGSGTPVGDPIEMRALTKAFRTFTRRTGYCAVGSVKSNVGHLDAAAAVAGIIKTVLALEHRQLPPTLHYSEANPEIDFASTPFFVNTRLRDWTSEGPRRAGVMATGMGGTNAHVVLEEAPAAGASADAGPPHLLVLSAKSEEALDQATHRLLDYLAVDASANLADVAHTLQVGRKAFAHRRCLVCDDRNDAVATLRDGTSKRILTARTGDSRRPLVMLLPGVGDHYVGMGYDLYRSWPVFTAEVDRCSAVLASHLGFDVRSILYPESRSWLGDGRTKGIDLKKMMLGAQGGAPQDPETIRLNATEFAQPALFTIEYATARLWQSLGVVPDAIVGHSMGEYVAACLSGVLSLEDALRLVATRARLANALAPGAMLAVSMTEDALRALLPHEMSIALINGPEL
jgi:acyl transferase domain-containing protein